MKNIYLIFIILFFCLVSCSDFDQEYFTNKAFGFNLIEAAEGKTTEEKNSLFIIHGVVENDNIFRKAFPDNIDISSTYVPAYHDNKEIGNSSWGKTISRQWKIIDGHIQMSIYYPQKRLLILGYLTAYGG